ncbi:hypothetical protein M0P48_04030 [Candidatus Gracilibacteria bacterium]|nr:hypothetical protein [Candidatus Gracilibacteria bacterium]
MSIINEKKGSALLTALLVMGVLLSVSLALSSLILREIYTTREVLDSGKAYYGAESGIEVSLYKIKHSLPGWETPEKGFVPLQIDEDKNVVTEYKVDNTCNAYPCFGSDFNKESAEANLTAFYDVLELNESITLPLFVVKDGVEHKVKNFTVEFYGIFNPQTDLKIKSGKGFPLSGWDILRWKILGISKADKTESISDFTALSMLNTAGEKNATNAANPSWFGSVRCQQAKGERYTNKIVCEDYGFGEDFQEVTLGEDVAKTVVGNCDNTKAREHYVYENGEVQSTVPCYPISTFLEGHRLNYLTLTNLMNPSVFDDKAVPTEAQRIAMSKLYFRVELFGEDGIVLNRSSVGDVSGNNTVREYAEIVSNGYSGDSKQSISVNLKRDSFMPVFNFSLYSTYKESSNKNAWK